MSESDPRMTKVFPLELMGVECVVLGSLVYEDLMSRRKSRNPCDAEIKAYRLMEELYAKIPKPMSEPK